MYRKITKKEWMEGCEKAYDLFYDNPEIIGSFECTVKRYAPGPLQLQLWIYNGEKGAYQYDMFNPTCDAATTLLGRGKNLDKVLRIRKRWNKVE